MKYLCIGDSHIGYFTNQHCLSGNTNLINEPFHIYCVGAVCAYNLIKPEKQQKIWNIINQNNGIKNLIFSFGEIDLRCHVFRRKSNISVENNIKLITNNYIRFLQQFLNYNVTILLPIMPRIEFNSNDFNNYPTGSLEERQYYTECFHDIMKLFTKNYIELETKLEYFFNNSDKIHLQPKVIWNQIEKWK